MVHMALDAGHTDPPTVLLVGGSPEPSAPSTVRRAAAGADVVVAIDRGYERVLAAGVACALFCGDGDSIGGAGAEAVRSAERAGSLEVVRYNPHKDDTDLGLALGEVARRWPAATVRATCLGGGHPDHLLGVVGRLAAYRPVGTRPPAAPAVEIVEDGCEGRVLHAGEAWDMVNAAGRRFSFIPLAPSAVVSEAGMRWELDHRRVPLLDDLGISNVIEADRARITCHEGVLVCWLFA